MVAVAKEHGIELRINAFNPFNQVRRLSTNSSTQYKTSAQPMPADSPSSTPAPRSRPRKKPRASPDSWAISTAKAR
jgi:hypothetical protein